MVEYTGESTPLVHTVVLYSWRVEVGDGWLKRVSEFILKKEVE